MAHKHKKIKKVKPTEKDLSTSITNEFSKVIEAGNELAKSAHYVQANYDGIHRLRLALSNWYKVRANEFGREKEQNKGK